MSHILLPGIWRLANLPAMVSYWRRRAQLMGCRAMVNDHWCGRTWPPFLKSDPPWSSIQLSWLLLLLLLLVQLKERWWTPRLRTYAF